LRPASLLLRAAEALHARHAQVFEEKEAECIDAGLDGAPLIACRAPPVFRSVLTRV
jgi:hypothetical protein